MSGYRPDNGFEGLMNLVRQELNEDTSQSTRTPAPQNVKTLQEPELDAEDVGMEDYSEEDLNKMPPQKAPKSKSKDDDRYSVREVPDSEVQNPAPKKESKLREKGWFYRVGDALREDVRFQKLVKRFGPTSDRVFRYVAQKEGTQTSKDLIQQLIDYATGVQESKVNEDKWGVWASVYGGPTGPRQAWTKRNGEVEVFATEEEAAEVARKYRESRSMYAGPTQFNYTPMKMDESKIQENGPLYLCNNCYSTFRNVEAFCPKCRSNIVERVVKEEAMDSEDDYVEPEPNESPVKEEDTSPSKRPHKNPEAIASAIAKAIGVLGYWHTETISYSDREEYEFITTEGPKVIVSVKTEEQGD